MSLWNSLLAECVLLTLDLIGFKSKVIRLFLSSGSFETVFLDAFYLFILLYHVTPCVIMAVQP